MKTHTPTGHTALPPSRRHSPDKAEAAAAISAARETLDFVVCLLRTLQDAITNGEVNHSPEHNYAICQVIEQMLIEVGVSLPDSITTGEAGKDGGR